MRKKILVLIAFVLCLLLLATMFVACNKKTDDLNRDDKEEAEARDNALLALSNALLSADSDTWKANMTDAEIAALSDAGDYIVSESWISFFCDVLDMADIRTSKIDALANVVTKAVQDEKDRQEKAKETTTPDDDDLKPTTLFGYIRLVVSQSDFLGSEMASLAYVLLREVIDHADTVYADAYNTCIRISERGDLSGDTRNNINAAKKDIERAKNYLDYQLPETKQQQILTSMENAKSDFQSIFTTMYETLAILSVDVSSLMKNAGSESSSISSLSTQDILNVLSSVKKTIGESNDYFANNQTKVRNVSQILREISDIVDTMAATNKIIGATITVVRYSGTALSILPFAVSFLYHSWDALDEDFINDIKEHVFAVEQPLDENYMIFFARMIKEYRTETGTDMAGSKEYTYDRIDELNEYVDNDKYAALLYMAADAVLNLTSSMRYIPGDDEAKNAYYLSILKPVLLYFELVAFQSKYADYVLDPDNNRDTLVTDANGLVDTIADINNPHAQYVVEKPTATTELDNAWYINFYQASLEAFFYSRDNTKAQINPDLKHYVDETYPYPTDNPVDYIEQIATSDFAITEDDAASTALKALADKVIIVKLLTIIPTILALFGA